MSASALDVQAVSGADGDLAEEVRGLWSRLGVQLPEAEQSRRLAAVVAVGRDGDGALQAVATAPTEAVTELDRVLLYRYRYLVAPAWQGSAVARQLLEAFVEVVAPAEHPAGTAQGIYTEMAGPGLDGPEPLAREEYAQLPFYFVRHLPGQRMARVAWFHDARITEERNVSQFDPMRQLADGYRLVTVAGKLDARQAEAVSRIWLELTDMTPQHVEERIPQIYVLAYAPDDTICGIMTAYRQPLPMGFAMHGVRAIMVPGHRKLNIPALMCAEFLADLQARFDAGEQLDSLGMFMEVQSESLRKHRNDAVWPATDAAFIGMTNHGFEFRVSYLRGARLPLPG